MTSIYNYNWWEKKHFNHPPTLPPDLLSSHPLHPPCASEERALLHRSADDPADHPLCIWYVPLALHEDGLPPPDDTAGSY